MSQYYDVGNLNFENENPYADSLFPSKNLRLLSLFRFWNIIKYFYPYHEINDKEWNAVLTQYIPEFIQLKDTLEYHLKIVEFASELNDGHIWIDESIPLAMHTGFFNPPYKLKYIDGRPVVFEFFPDSLGALQDLKLGDQILEINDVPVEKIFSARKKYYSFSNIDHFNRRLTDELLITPCSDSMKLLIRRDNRDMTVKLKVVYLYELYEMLWSENESKEAYRIINDTIGYINLRYLEKSEVDSVMSQLLGMQKIIIDIRNYPHGVLYELSKYFNPAPTNFVKIFAPNIAMPGQFIRTLTMQTGDSNELYYKGELRLIVNEQTQSHAEFTAMCLQSAPNVITVGSTTAGTDGNVSYVFLPGGIRCQFTGIGIEYPDGTPTQRVGIKIDTIVRPRMTDVKRNYDRLLEVAIRL